MKIATFNTNSVRARISIILDWIEKEKPDILCLQETKVQDKDFPSSSFENIGYETVFKGQKSYNGVAFISKDPVFNVLRDLNDKGDEQARFISCMFLDVPIVNAYVPQGFAPGTDKFDFKLKWLKDLLSHIKSKYNPQEPLMLVGDFNVALEPVDVYDPEGLAGTAGFHEDEQEIMREFINWGLIDAFRERHPVGRHYTFWDYRIPNGFKRNMGWRIDYIFATRPLLKKIRDIRVDTEPRGKEKPSDHTFLVAEFEDFANK